MDFALPEIGEGVYEAELVRWLVQPGAAVKPGQALVEVMTDKATMEVPSPFSGTIDAVLHEPGHRLKIGDVLLRYSGAGVPASSGDHPVPIDSAPAPTTPPVMRPTNGPAATPLSVRAAPSVRHMARKLGIDLARVNGTGPDGRILIDDLTTRLKATPHEAAAPKREPAFDLGTPGTRQKLVGLRRRIAEHLVHATRTIPHYSYIDECDVTALVALRASLKSTFERGGVKLTYLPFFVRAVVAALKKVPLVNASLDEQANEIVLHDRYNIGIAVATPGGLIVPVVQDADKKDIGTIAREIDRLSADARTGKSKREDLRGGTFTLTSIGNVGGLISTPVINHPEVGILGLGRIVRRPVYDRHENVRPADILYLSFSFDHRVVDGAIGAVFGNAVMEQLQTPAALLLPEKL